MIRYEKGQCDECPKGQLRFIVKKLPGRHLCHEHNQRRLTKKRRETRPKEGSGELEFFNKLWDHRPHICFITQTKIKESPKKNFKRWLMCFSHVLTKQHYPKYRLNPENIVFKQPEMHRRYHSWPKSKLMNDPVHGDRWKAFFELKARLALEYNNG